jgi:hypothetical protein
MIWGDVLGDVALGEDALLCLTHPTVGWRTMDGNSVRTDGYGGTF